MKSRPSGLPPRSHFSGFTLIELMVVMSIISLLASVVIASVSSARAKAIIASGITFDKHTYTAMYDDLVAAWDFEGLSATPTSVPDESPNGNTLNLATGVTTDSSTPTGSGKSLIVPSGRTTATTVALKNHPTGSFSVSFWINMSVVTTVNILSNTYNPPRNSANQRLSGGWVFTPQDSQVYFNVYKYPYWYNAPTPSRLTANTWYHLVGTCDTNTRKAVVYLNGVKGVPVDIGTGGCVFKYSQPTYATDKIYLASPADLGSPTYKIDNIRIYNKALPIAQVEGIYLAEKEKFDRLAVEK